MIQAGKSVGTHQDPDLLHIFFLHHKSGLHAAVFHHEIRKVIADPKILFFIALQRPVNAVDPQTVGKGKKAAPLHLHAVLLHPEDLSGDLPGLGADPAKRAVLKTQIRHLLPNPAVFLRRRVLLPFAGLLRSCVLLPFAGLLRSAGKLRRHSLRKREADLMILRKNKKPFLRRFHDPEIGQKAFLPVHASHRMDHPVPAYDSHRPVQAVRHPLRQKGINAPARNRRALGSRQVLRSRRVLRGQRVLFKRKHLIRRQRIPFLIRHVLSDPHRQKAHILHLPADIPDRQRSVKKAVPVRKKHLVLPPIPLWNRISAFRKQGGDPLQAFPKQIPILRNHFSRFSICKNIRRKLPVRQLSEKPDEIFRL